MMGKKVLTAKSRRAACSCAATGGGCPVGVFNAEKQSSREAKSFLTGLTGFTGLREVSVKPSKTKPSGVAWIGDIPEGWETLRNKWCFSCSKSIVGKASETAQLLSLTTSVVKCKGKEVLGGKLPESFDTYQEVSQNDLILCLFDMDCSAVFSGLSRFDGMISPAYKVVKCKSCIEPKYADYWFKFVGSQRFFKHYAKNIRYSLTFDEFAELMMIVPPLFEQRAIADYLDEKCGAIDAAVAEAKKGIEEYKAWKKSLIFEVVTGKRRVGFFNAESQSGREDEALWHSLDWRCADGVGGDEIEATRDICEWY
ncbi:hypothetical protein [Fibrobacter sp.]|uniref:hypothetical protein n=1 Tax=Fibrobacter sp. TaxID=35828 RepID=UPI00388E19C2